MRILIPVKRVIDYNVKVRVKSDRSGVDLQNIKMSMNPFDEIAVEEAVRLKEKGEATEVIAVSIGTEKSQETLRTALAMGADRAILVKVTDSIDFDVEPLAVAKILSAIAQEEEISLVICGKQAIDNDANATGQMISALLKWSQSTFVSKIDLQSQPGYICAEREVDGGIQKIKSKLPSVVTVDLRLNEPRYASLPNIMKAKKKPITIKTHDDYGIDISPRLNTISVAEPPVRSSGIILDNANELVRRLREEENIL